jgi:hypothetical protein
MELRLKISSVFLISLLILGCSNSTNNKNIVLIQQSHYTDSIQIIKNVKATTNFIKITLNQYIDSVIPKLYEEFNIKKIKSYTDTIFIWDSIYCEYLDFEDQLNLRQTYMVLDTFKPLMEKHIKLSIPDDSLRRPGTHFIFFSHNDLKTKGRQLFTNNLTLFFSHPLYNQKKNEIILIADLFWPTAYIRSYFIKVNGEWKLKRCTIAEYRI